MRQPAANKQIIVITDGEPTAHIEGREVVLIYPPAEKTANHTLAEVRPTAPAPGSASPASRWSRITSTSAW